MSDDGGFVERPKRYHGSETIMGRLRQTAENGKAIRLARNPGNISGQMRSAGYRIHKSKQPDGTYLAWAEHIEAPK